MQYFLYFFSFGCYTNKWLEDIKKNNRRDTNDYLMKLKQIQRSKWTMMVKVDTDTESEQDIFYVVHVLSKKEEPPGGGNT